ncbi:hypothetical protein LH991_13775 [Schleiferilactobacillus harbinensis]|nr:hypothetical protein [Schleiferilactobacillus harbinensis]MBO3092066.1 hypothetical protein [Schleiferilactobacillus harbinensis]MCI1687140.1 hypothetical protein [Schleiferilactobacillus harbinensis]MCI1849989.1 hypothetical protein [Schleiferilactobacillus harbinensis]QFR23533.1 hypothetical protein D1010_09010 [Schleiferilactobacillus harbinensis]QFR64937.1 hypothetical protein LH991_13775 [Schleiferilactobacillus harbinensis]
MMIGETYWYRLAALVDRFSAAAPGLRGRCQRMQQFAAALAQRQLPPQGLPDLTLSAGEIAALLVAFPNETGAIRTLDRLFNEFRHVIQRQFGVWAMLTAPFADTLAAAWQGRRVVELMAGNGMLSAGLAQRGVTMTATDDRSWVAANGTGQDPWYPIQDLPATQAVAATLAQTDAYVWAWSPDGVPVDWAVLQQLRAAQFAGDLLVIGEFRGVTDSQEFWDHAHLHTTPLTRALNRQLHQFDLINERAFLIS